MNSPRNTFQSGFSVVELMCSILVLGLAAAGVLGIFISQRKVFDAQEQIMEMNQNVRSAVDLMTREIRMAALNGVIAATSTMIRLRADLDQNGSITPDEDIAYAFDDKARQVSRTTQDGVNSVVAENVTTFSLIYTMKDGTQTQTPGNLSQIRIVQISITAQTAHPDPSGQYRVMTLTSDITPRNMCL